jgi:hypothetical protein
MMILHPACFRLNFHAKEKKSLETRTNTTRRQTMNIKTWFCGRTKEITRCVSFTSALLLAASSLQAPGSAQITFPSSAVVNVKNYGAKGNGTNDDTAAINNAIKANIGTGNVLFFPAGTYLVSNRLEWRTSNGTWYCYLSLKGAGQSHTTIKLKNNCSGYTSSQSPRSVIHTASLNSHNPSNVGGEEGAGNDGYRNHIEDLTIDVGTGNVGAIGIDWCATNEGGMRNVTVKSGNRQGKYGINLGRALSAGPNFLRNVTVNGFDYGIHADEYYSSGSTIDTISLSNQNIAGIYLRYLSLAIRNLTSNNTVPAIRASDGSLTTIVGATFSGGAAGNSAVDISGDGAFYGRNLSTSGYLYVVKKGTTTASGGWIGEWTSNPVISQFPSTGRSLSLAIKTAPTFHDSNMSNWVNVYDYGARADDFGDDSQAIQAAIDAAAAAGKTTVYFPSVNYGGTPRASVKQYHIGRTINVYGSVRHIWGGNCEFYPSGSAFSDPNNPQPYFRVENNSGANVIFEKMKFMGGTWINGMQGAIFITQNTITPLVLRDVAASISSGAEAQHKWMYQNTARNPVELYLEGVSGDKWDFSYGQKVWAWNLNPEGSALNPKISNNGSQLWILGCKTEGNTTFVSTFNNGQTEILGGMIWGIGGSNAAISSVNSQLSVVAQFPAYQDSEKWAKLVEETRSGSLHTLLYSHAPRQRFGNVLTLYSGF